MKKKGDCFNIERNIHYLKKRDINIKQKCEWGKEIEYQIGDYLDNKSIEKALNIISNNTCLKFKKSSDKITGRKGLSFEYKDFCASYVGCVFNDKPQQVYLTYKCSSEYGRVLHEVGHALGLVHEHSRSDRDEFVQIHNFWIRSGAENEFAIQNPREHSNLSVTYDYSSIMHYGTTDGTWFEWFPTITAKKYKLFEFMMRQNKNMTFNDFKQINLLHCVKCNWVDMLYKKYEKKYERAKWGKCYFGGYPDYRHKNCKKCICPKGYTGDKCGHVEKSNEKNCNGTFLWAFNHRKWYTVYGIRKCFVLFKSANNQKVKLMIAEAHARNLRPCTEDYAHQVKYLKDKGNTGLLICNNNYDTINVTSEGYTILLYYNGQRPNDYFIAAYQSVSSHLPTAVT
uniref:Metalloendopeptidase n=1 Tax=Strongyloides papillosus TaxID=174720 RepID=A0A0N5CHK0_STREA